MCLGVRWGTLVSLLIPLATLAACAGRELPLDLVAPPVTRTEVPVKVWVVLQYDDNEFPDIPLVEPGCRDNFGCRLTLEEIEEIVGRMVDMSPAMLSSDALLTWDGTVHTFYTTELVIRSFPEYPDLRDFIEETDSWGEEGNPDVINIYFVGKFSAEEVSDALAVCNSPDAFTDPILLTPFNHPAIVINDGGPTFDPGADAAVLIDEYIAWHEMGHYLGHLAHPDGSPGPIFGPDIVLRTYNSGEHCEVLVPNIMLEGDPFLVPFEWYIQYHKPVFPGNPEALGTERGHIVSRVRANLWNDPN
jgi:hypothetical protein